MHMSGRILCGETASVRAQYMIEMQELRAEQESLDFFFLVSLCAMLSSNVTCGYMQLLVYFFFFKLNLCALKSLNKSYSRSLFL